MIPYSRHCIDKSDIEAVVEVLESDWLTQGPSVSQFEEAISQYCGAEYCVSFNSATSALHLACLALGVGEGDVVWTSPISFVASANCAVYCGAKVDFVDIDAGTFNICLIDLAQRLEVALINKATPKVLITVDLAGTPVDARDIYGLCQKYGVKIIEDASHALGARYCNRHVGGTTYADITVFSLHPVKMITAGEGGLAVTASSDIANTLRLLSRHGIERDPSSFIEIHARPWAYEQQVLGFNFRMSDIHAALGLSQLRKLDNFVDKRRKIVSRYVDALSDLPISFQVQTSDSKSSYHLCIILVQEESKVDRDQLFQMLRAAGVFVQVHYIPIFMHSFHKNSQRDYRAEFPNASNYYSNCLSIPCFPNLSDRDQSTVINLLVKYLA